MIRIATVLRRVGSRRSEHAGMLTKVASILEEGAKTAKETRATGRIRETESLDHLVALLRSTGEKSAAGEIVGLIKELKNPPLNPGL